jgi:hypothetical protein
LCWSLWTNENKFETWQRNASCCWPLLLGKIAVVHITLLKKFT